MGAIAEIDVLCITAGLACDGDTIAMTAATQPSLEDLVFGALPFVPKIKLRNPFLDYENGEEFMKVFHQAAEGELMPFILVIEGSIPNEKSKSKGYWATFGTDQKTGQPILTSNAVATYGRAIHALRRFTQASLNKEPRWRGRAGRSKDVSSGDTK